MTAGKAGAAQTVKPARPSNRLIEALPRKERERLLACCRQVDLVFGSVLCEADAVVEHVYFPLDAFVSLVAKVAGHQPMEIGLIGNEGMLGATLALGVNTVPLRAVVQGSGSALRATAAQLRRELHRSPALQRMLKRYLYVVMAQLSQTVGCTRFHEIEPRLARWLLMTHDRSPADHFHLTHDYLAQMLGVQRSAISIAAGGLQRRKLIGYTRGEITVLNRPGLEAASCECYDAIIEDYARVLA